MDISARYTRIGPALGKVASGLYIATSHISGMRVGMLCSFVEQAGIEPPMISIALGPARPIIAAIEEHGLFGLNILSRQNGKLVKSFCRDDIPDPFAEHALVENEYSLPQLADAWAFLVCRASGKLPSGDHILYVAEVIDGALQQEGQEAMIRIRQNGFGY